MIVPASTRKIRNRRQALSHRIGAEGQRYGGISSTNVGAGPGSTVRRMTAAAASVTSTDNVYIENSATAPALNQPSDCPAKTVPTTKM
jgi:hypothetical protein